MDATTNEPASKSRGADRAWRAKFHLYLLIEQSNIAGCGEVAKEDRKPHPRVFKRTITKLQGKLLDLAEKKKFYVMVKDLRYNSEETVGKMKNGRAVENELAGVLPSRQES